MIRTLTRALAVLFCVLASSSPVAAHAIAAAPQGSMKTRAIPQMPPMPNMGSAQVATQRAPIGPPVRKITAAPGIQVNLQTGDTTPQKLSTGVELALFITLLTLAPAIVLSLTSFTRIVIVLSFMKRAMSVQELPPALIVTGFAFFLSLFIMKPTLDRLYTDAWVPYSAEEITLPQAADIADDVMSAFLSKQTRPSDLALMYDVARKPYPKSIEEVPFHLLVPAFVLSEIKTAFQMGFVLFLPFLVIDLVISSVLISMGMFTLPPIVVSTPLKLLLFILVDGWNLVVGSLAQSFAGA